MAEEFDHKGPILPITAPTTTTNTTDARSLPPPSPISSTHKQEYSRPLPVAHPPQGDVQERTPWRVIKAHALSEVNPDKAMIPLVAFCFMTGYIDAIGFTACFIWCAFQTGNTIQLGLAIARLFSGPHPLDHSFHIADRQALTSLLSFLAGAFLGRIGDKIGPKRRVWLFTGTLIQAAFSLAACLTAHAAARAGETGFATDRGNPSWSDGWGFVTLGLISASMGLQAHLGTRLGSHYATSVVLTTIWVQIMGDPQLFQPQKRAKARDNRLLAVLFLLIGGIVGRALVNTIGSSSTLAIGAGVRVLIAFGWLVIDRTRKDGDS